MTVLAVTLNAAIDKRYDIASLTVGQVHRVVQVSAGPGGKGINVARAVRLCGRAAVATGFVAGSAGRFITERIVELGITDAFIRVAGESRTCINVVDDAGRSTELLEPGVQVTAADIRRLVRQFEDLLDGVRVVTLSGSAPAGCPDDVYVPLILAARRAGRAVVLDTSGPLLAAGLEAGPTVAKPNRGELAALVGADLPDLASLVDAARAVRHPGTEWVVVSLGSDGAVAVGDRRAVHVGAPVVSAINPVGCGDVLVGGLAAGLAAGLDVEVALPLAVRISAASAAHRETGVFDPAHADRLASQVHVTTV